MTSTSAWLLSSFSDAPGFAAAELERYAAAFTQYDLDTETLDDLGAAGLADIGVDNAVHRSKIIRAWKASRTGSGELQKLHAQHLVLMLTEIRG